MTTPSLNEHLRVLAADLLDDIELSRTTVSQQVFKAVRLARQVGDDSAHEWLEFESLGVPGTPEGRAHMSRTLRWTDESADIGLWGAVAEFEEMIPVLRGQLESSHVDSLSGEYLTIVTREMRAAQATISSQIAKFSRIVVRVRAMLHDFARRTYYELEFSAEQGRMFESARAEIDGLLAPRGGKALEKIESIYRRLSEGDPEAASQAMNTCRRLIDSFADAIYPAVTGGAIEIDGTKVDIGADKTKNRINAFVADHVTSKSRRDRLRRSLADIYKRTSTAVHADVSPDEARYLFLATYIMLGEILSTQGTADPDPK